jgi:hypothetical protein
MISTFAKVLRIVAFPSSKYRKIARIHAFEMFLNQTCLRSTIAQLVAVLVVMSSGALSQSHPQFSGVAFGDYYYNISNHAPASRDMQAFDYRRIFITADDSLAPYVTGRFRIESDPTSTTLANNKLSVAVKDAYVNWSNVAWGGDVRFGLQPTPVIDIADAVFGYRVLEKSLQDLHNISGARDFGISIHYPLTSTTSAILMVGNNSNNMVWTNKYKRAYAQLTVKPMQGLVLALTGDYSGAPSGKYLRTGDLLANYSTRLLSIGLQAYIQDVDHNAYSGTTGNGNTSRTSGVAVQGWVALTDNFRLVGRYDFWEPGDAFGDAASNPLDNGWNLVVAGLDYSYSANIHVLPNVEYISYDLPGTESDVTARMTLSVTF